MTTVVKSARAYNGDEVNRANSDSAGGPWRSDVNGQARVRSNRLEFKTMPGSPGRAGTWMSADGLLTDNYEVRAQLAPRSEQGLATDNFTCIMLAVPDVIGSAGSLITYFVGSTGNGSAIYTQTGTPNAAGISTGDGSSGRVRRTTPTANITETSLIALRRTMYSATQSNFTCYLNGSLLATWTDSSGLVPTGPSNRRFGFIVEGNHPFANSEYRSPAIDWIEAYDLS